MMTVEEKESSHNEKHPVRRRSSQILKRGATGLRSDKEARSVFEIAQEYSNTKRFHRGLYAQPPALSIKKSCAKCRPLRPTFLKYARAFAREYVKNGSDFRHYDDILSALVST